MIVLDTNVVSELISAQPSEAVLSWLASQPADTLYLTTITLAEVRYGLAILPEGRRRLGLSQQFEGQVRVAFGDRVLPFDEQASMEYARMKATARGAGKAISDTDGYIAAIALAHGFAVATRDRSPFEAAGVKVIDPF